MLGTQVAVQAGDTAPREGDDVLKIGGVHVDERPDKRTHY